MEENGFSRNLTSLAYEQLRAHILGGELGPNERLRIQSLSERYDIGPTAIREALSRLVTEGLVATEDQRGFFVSPVSRDELQDLTKTRTWVEQAALRMSIEQGDLEWETAVLGSFHRLSRLSAPSDDPANADAWKAAHRQFHFALLGGCRSPWTVKLCAMLYDQTERYRNLSGRTKSAKTRNVLTEHQHLMDTVLARNADHACELLARHFLSTTNIILEVGIVGETSRESRPGRKKAA